MNNTAIQENTGINAFYARIYSLVGIGIGLSALVSFLMLTVFQEAMVNVLINARWLVWGSWLVEMALVFAASSQAMKNSPSALPLFLGYSALNGFTLSFTLAMYRGTSVFSAFVSSSILFFVMAIIGRFSKKDLSGVGQAALAGLFGVIIAGVVNLFLHSSGLSFILSIVTVLIFAGLIAWDNQKIRYVYEQTGGNVGNGWAVSMALSLYLDFINLFLSLLRIFARND